MFLKTFVRVLLVAIVLALIGIGMVDYLKNFDQNECSMTYMYDYPLLIPINLDDDSFFSDYKLFLYCEGYFCQKSENLIFNQSGLVPVLFITGNADSHMQVRSLASVSLEKSKSKYPKIKFLYFTISFNEELSAIYGPVIEKQTLYARKCIKKILSLFDKMTEHNRPKNVVVIGNSMGGIVARNILSLRVDDSFDLNSVTTIITKSSPHNRPVIDIDSRMSRIYQDINKHWLNSSDIYLKNTVLVSLYGGHRDILVRSGLSNIKDWNNLSKATIISAYTESIPYVWRSIDHRCMAWCRELILTVTRALFNLVDPQTSQIYESQEVRAGILAKHFNGIETSYKMDKIKLDKQLTIIDKKSEIFYEFNSFNPKNQESVLFNLSSLEINFDSLFIYTNLNKKYSISLCEDVVDAIDCLNPIDLGSQFGKVIPPLYKNKKMSLNTININNLKDLIKKYNFLLIKIPICKTIEAHQIILKLDWYNKSERFNYLSSELEDIKLDLFPTFSRIYLPSIKNVFQVYNVEKVPLKNSCDFSLRKQMDSANIPLLSSCLMIILNEQHVNHIINSEFIQLKSKNISIKLSKNIDDDNQLLFIDIIKFNPTHLLRSGKSKNTSQINSDGYTIRFKFDFVGSLGQFVRFYGVFFPAFLTAILQFYDIVSLRSLNPTISSLFLEHYNRNIRIHLCLILVLFSLNFLPTYYKKDSEILSYESLDFSFLPILLHLSAYGMLIILSFFITVISIPIKLFMKKILFRMVPFINSKKAKILCRFFSLALFVTAAFYSSTLAICILFYFELLSIIIYETDPLFNQTRLFFMYFILVLNVPGLIVWAKSVSHSSIRPMNEIFEDSATEAAQGFFAFVILNWIKFEAGMMQKFSLDKNIISILLFVNLLMTILHSMIHLHRLQYFILAHLFIVSLRTSVTMKKIVEEKQD